MCVNARSESCNAKVNHKSCSPTTYARFLHGTRTPMTTKDSQDHTHLLHTEFHLPDIFFFSIYFLLLKHQGKATTRVATGPEPVTMSETTARSVLSTLHWTWSRAPQRHAHQKRRQQHRTAKLPQGTPTATSPPPWRVQSSSPALSYQLRQTRGVG